MTHKHSWEFREDGHYCEDCGDKLGDAKEQINKTLAEFDERVDHWHVAVRKDDCALCSATWIDSRIPEHIECTYNPDYCSSVSPRSLLEGIEAQLTKDQKDHLHWALTEAVSASSRFTWEATGAEKAKAIYGILEKE